MTLRVESFITRSNQQKTETHNSNKNFRVLGRILWRKIVNFIEGSEYVEKGLKCYSLNSVRLFATPWTATHKAPLSMEFSRQEYWSGVPYSGKERKIKKMGIHEFFFFFLSPWSTNHILLFLFKKLFKKLFLYFKWNKDEYF